VHVHSKQPPRYSYRLLYHRPEHHERLSGRNPYPDYRSAGQMDRGPQKLAKRINAIIYGRAEKNHPRAFPYQFLQP